jgi:hypothetical protein
MMYLRPVAFLALLAVEPGLWGEAVAPAHRGAGTVSVQTDSLTYHLEADTAYPGSFRLRMRVNLENRTRDTVWLAFPCSGGPQLARTFLRARDLSHSILGVQACAASAIDTPKPRAFALPPLVTTVDTIIAPVFGYRPGSHEIRLEYYLDAYRVAYSRWIRRGFFRRSWQLAPATETISNEFRVHVAK